MATVFFNTAFSSVIRPFPSGEEGVSGNDRSRLQLLLFTLTAAVPAAAVPLGAH